MSLIEEALRRQQEDAGKAPRAGVPPSPSLSAKLEPPPPEPPPEEPEEEPADDNRSRKRILTVVAVVALLVAAGAGWWEYSHVKNEPPPQPAAETATVPHAHRTRKAAAATNAAALPASNVVSAARLAAVTNVVAVTNAPVATAAAPATNPAPVLALPSGSVSNAVALQSTNATPPLAQASAAPPTNTVSTAPAVPVVVWPSLHLSGLLDARDSGKGTAIINNHVVGVGERVDGAMLISVSAAGVELEFQGERRFVKVNANTE